MIEQLRREAQELRNHAEELTAQAARMISEAQAKEREANRLESEEERNNLINTIANAMAAMSIDDLREIVTHFGVENNHIIFEAEPHHQSAREQTVTPQINVEQQVVNQETNEAPQRVIGGTHNLVEEENSNLNQENNENNDNQISIGHEISDNDLIDSDSVTPDMITEEMRNANITLIGIKYQDLCRVHHRIPAIGDRVTLAKRNNVETQNTVGYINGNISIGILPAGDEKIAQLTRLNLSILNNHEVGLNHSALQKEYEVVGVIPGSFIFLNEVGNNNTTEITENEEEHTSTVDANINMSINRIEGIAHSIEEARRLFESQHPNTCTITQISARDNDFLIHYINHRINSDNFRCCAIVDKGE